VFYADEETGEHILAGEQIDSLYNLVRMVVETNRKTGITQTFLMTFISSYDYLISKKSLRKNSYLKRASDFDGTVLFHTLQREFVNGWKYKKGKIVDGLLPKEGEGASTRAGARTRGSGEYCMIEWTEYYSKSFIKGHEEDATYHVGIDKVSVTCFSGGGVPQASPGEIIPPTIPSGLQIPSTISLPSSVKKLIKYNRNLTNTQVQRLQKALEDMQKFLCYSNAVYNYLSSNGISYDEVGIDLSLGGDAANVFSSNGTTDLMFRGELFIGATDLSHEIFHLFQRQQGQYQGKESFGMMEYERAFTEDILFYAKYKGKPSYDDWLEKPTSGLISENKPKRSDPRYEQWEKADKAYKKWLRKITKGGTKTALEAIQASDFSTKFNEWKSFFADYSRPYSASRGYNYNVNYAATALKTALKLAASAGCY
jgi:hypothetical protein